MMRTGLSPVQALMNAAAKLSATRFASRSIGAVGAVGAVVAVLSLGLSGARAAEVETIEIGLGAGHVLIEGLRVAAGNNDAPLVALIGGFAGEDDSSREMRETVAAYAALPDSERGVEVVAMPVANPAQEPLQFPPTGAAYRENAASHALWRWLGLVAPDMVIVYGTGASQSALGEAIRGSDVAGVGPLLGVALSSGSPVLRSMSTATVRPSRASLEIERRRARAPADLAALLAPIYGQSWDTPIYIDGMALIAHLDLGDLALVERLAAPYVDGTRDSLQAGPNGVSTLTLAGHLVFAELAERTGDARYLARARAAADLSFDAGGQPLEAVPNHGEMSDAIFMGSSILAAVGDLTGERKYFDMAVRQIDFMNRLVRRDDGLYRHSPLTDAAWGRGNGFSAIGYALTLSKLPESHPDRARLLGEYRDFMQTLARWQNEDGTWRQVIDHPGSYHETSSTAIIGFSMQRGINRSWIDRDEFEPVVARAFAAVSQRTDENGGFIDVSESTNKQPSLEAYLDRAALAGRDARTGGFALLFAVERGR